MVGKRPVLFKNTDNASKKYKLTHFPAGTALTVNAARPSIHSIIAHNLTPSSQTTQFPSLGPSHSPTGPLPSFSFPTHSHPPGIIPTCRCHLLTPKGLNATFSLYSGFNEIAAPSENLHIMYIGLAASLKDKQVVDSRRMKCQCSASPDFDAFEAHDG